MNFVRDRGLIPRSESEARRAAIARLAGLCRSALTGETGGGEVLQEDALLLELVAAGRLSAACGLGVSRTGRAPGPELGKLIQAARGRAMIANGRVIALAKEAFALLDGAGIPAIAFKGPFQHLQLHGDPFFCRANDLDLLVARADFPAALALFEGRGFVRKEGTSPWWTRSLGEVHLHHPSGGVIDLHHRLQQPGCPPPRDLAAFLDSPARARLGAVEVAVPRPAQSLLICALNLAKEFVHRRRSARYAFDLAAGLMRLDETERAAFARMAGEQGLAGTAAFCVAMSERLFAVRLPLPLSDRPLPAWAERGRLRAMAFDPEHADTSWPRRREVIRELCSAGPDGSGRLAFARETARLGLSEALRRMFPSPA